MSIEYYIEGFLHESHKGIDINRVIHCFQPTIEEAEDSFYTLNYDELNSCEMSLSIEQGEVTSICIHNPCDHERLDQDIIQLLRVGPYVLFAPDGNALIVGSEEIRKSVPADMVEELGQPIVVEAGAVFSKLLFG